MSKYDMRRHNLRPLQEHTVLWEQLSRAMWSLYSPMVPITKAVAPTRPAASLMITQTPRIDSSPFYHLAQLKVKWKLKWKEKWSLPTRALTSGIMNRSSLHSKNWRVTILGLILKVNLTLKSVKLYKPRKSGLI